MIKKNHTYDTIKFYLGRIKGFLHAFKLRPTPEIEINKKRILEDSKYALNVGDIRKAIKHSNPTYQTIIIVQAQTGLSISDVLLFDVGDFILADLHRKKLSNEFYPFAGPETLRSISSLLESRDKHLKPESPIFLKDTQELVKNVGKRFLRM